MAYNDRYRGEAPSSWWEREDRWRDNDGGRPAERGSFAREQDGYDRPRPSDGWRVSDDPYVDYGQARDGAARRASRGGEFGRDYGPAAPYRSDRGQGDYARRAYGEAQWSPSLDDRPTYGDRDYVTERTGRAFRPEPGGFDEPRGGTGRAAYGWRDDRGWWDHAKDRVAGAFGDSDAQRRADWDSYQREAGREGGHRGKGPKGYSRSDDRVREDVSDRLSDDSWLDASSIEVAAKSGEVTLNGSVFTRDDKRRAEDLADGVSGVNHVQNNLRVQRGGDVYGVDTTPTQQAAGSTTGKVS